VPTPSCVPTTEPKEYDRLGLDRIIYAQVFSEDKLIEFLTQEYGNLYLSSIGVWEGYTLKDHSLMALRQFEKYFGHHILPGNTDRGVFRLALALHDIGVPRALQTGDKSMEFRYSREMVEDFLRRYNFQSRDVDLATALVSVDPMGAYIKSAIDSKATDKHKYWVSKTSCDTVIVMAANCQMDVNTYFDLLLIFYMVDAGSYTVAAGGKPGLDGLFVFEPSKRSIRFSPNVQRAIDKFRRLLNPGPGCMWVSDHDLHSVEYKYLRDWVKTPENMHKMDKGDVVWGHTFTYGKYHGQYHVKLRKEYDVAFYHSDY